MTGQIVAAATVRRGWMQVTDNEEKDKELDHVGWGLK